jgi:pyruvate-ferredoxin/flavodoxin oxidoreductase
LKDEGKNPFSIDSKPATADYKEFILGEARYSSLTRSFPDRAEELFDKAAEAAKASREHLEKLQELYGK